MRRVMTVLRRTYGRYRVTTKRPAIEELLLGIIVQGTSESKAVTALNAMAQHFVDWNEVRVTTASELAEAMPGIPDAIEKAEVIRSVLSHLYELANEMSLDFLREAGSRERMRFASCVPSFPEAALARATMVGLGEPVFPPTPKVLRMCKRVGLLDSRRNQRDMPQLFERVVPKPSMLEFHWLVSRHAETVCLKDRPGCSECGLQKCCRRAMGTTKNVRAKAKVKTKTRAKSGAKAKAKPRSKAKAGTRKSVRKERERSRK